MPGVFSRNRKQAAKLDREGEKENGCGNRLRRLSHRGSSCAACAVLIGRAMDFGFYSMRGL